MNIASVILKAADWVGHTSMSAAIIVLCVALIQLSCGRILPARARLVLWWLVVIRLLLPGLPPSPFSVANLPVARRAPIPTVSEATEVSVNPSAQSRGYVIVPSSSRADRVPSWRAVVPTLWLAGALTYLLAVLGHHWKLARWVRCQAPHEPSRELLSQWANRLGVADPVEIIVTSSLAVPAVFGMRRPRILIPAHLLESLGEGHLRLVILHELVHIKRKDVLQNWLLIVLQSVHWFNPAIWFAFGRLRAERELVCDRRVLTHLTGEARGEYGTLLIKLAELSAARLAVPTLVPILNHKKHIERRIRMIPKFKVVSIRTAVVSALAVAAIACVVLTGATERQPPAKGPDLPVAAPNRDSAKNRERTLEQMGVELEKLSAMIQDKQQQLDTMKERLSISALDEADKPDPDLLRRMEALRVEQRAESDRVSSLYSGLTNLSRSELIKSISTTSPDPLLIKLLEQLSTVEQQFAEDIEAYGATHPQVKRTKRVLEQINTQVNDRLDGILQGLKVRSESTQGSLDRLTKEVQGLKDTQIRRSIEQRPYFRAKRELENLQNVYDELYRRFLESKIDVKLSPEVPAK